MKGKSVLPRELEFEIFLQLPVKSLIRLKSVSRNWYFLIGSPLFNIRYSISSNAKEDNTKLLCFRKDSSIQSHIISIIDCQSTNKIIDLEWPPFLDEGVEDKKCHRGIRILGPVNGIYCIFNRLIEWWVGTLVLWNPATKEYKHLFPFAVFPFPSRLVAHHWNNIWDYEWKRPDNLTIGFGFDYNASDFKVIIISRWGRVHGGDDDRWHARVYNLYSNSWRTLYYLGSYMNVVVPFPGISPPFPNVDREQQFNHCLLNGVFHWSSEWNDNILGLCQGILAFDMTHESFQLIHGPLLPTVASHELWVRCPWVFQRTLALVASPIQLYSGNPTGNIQVWIMGEYGVKDSWAMLYSFGPIAGLSLIGIPNDDQIFFRDRNGQLVSSNFEDKSFKEHKIHGIRELLEPLGIHESLGVLKYVETLVRLDSNLMESKILPLDK